MAGVPVVAEVAAGALACERLYVIVDNFSPHKRAEVRAWAAVNDVELVFLPTYSSWLNW
ncbi:transposase, partial [Nocardia amamiensis]|uniref:transposase n=1 Tax=Nocardia amamiensis TaxID=404578 RepID=UPI001E3B99E5